MVGRENRLQIIFLNPVLLDNFLRLVSEAEKVIKIKENLKEKRENAYTTERLNEAEGWLFSKTDNLWRDRSRKTRESGNTYY